MYAIVEISLLCTIVEKNVNDSRDFRLYLWSAVNVRITVQYCRNIPFVNCRVIVVYGTLWQVKLASHNNDTTMATDVDELVRRCFRVLDSLLSQCQRQRSQCNRDPSGSEHCKDKMEDYILIVVAMKAAVDENTVPNPSWGSLLDNLIAAMEREIEKLTEVLDSCPTDDLKFLRKLAESEFYSSSLKGSLRYTQKFFNATPLQSCFPQLFYLLLGDVIRRSSPRPGQSRNYISYFIGRTTVHNLA